MKVRGRGGEKEGKKEKRPVKRKGAADEKERRCLFERRDWRASLAGFCLSFSSYLLRVDTKRNAVAMLRGGMEAPKYGKAGKESSRNESFFGCLLFARLPLSRSRSTSLSPSSSVFALLSISFLRSSFSLATSFESPNQAPLCLREARPPPSPQKERQKEALGESSGALRKRQHRPLSAAGFDVGARQRCLSRS